MHVIVVGAGVTGLATAWTLLRGGIEVTLVEQAQAPAQGASGQNGAQLSYAYVAPMASPATLRNMPALLMDGGSPLRLRPGLSWALWTWCARFLLACNGREAQRSTRALLDLGALSREHFEQWRGGVAATAIDYAANGKLVLMRDERSWRAAREQVALQARWGPPQRLLSESECLGLEPALAMTGGAISGGVLTESEAVADCARVCARLARDLAGRCRLHWSTQALGWRMEGRQVVGLQVRPADGQGPIEMLRADAYVVANGVAAPELLDSLGLHLPIAALKGYSIELPEAALGRMPRLSVTDSARKIVFAPLGEPGRRRLRVAGMAELVGNDLRIDPRRIQQLCLAAEQLFGLDEATPGLRPWAGQRPSTPTGRPYIGRLPTADNVFVNAGQGALGFTLAFGSAVLLCDALLRHPPRLADIGAFTPA